MLAEVEAVVGDKLVVLAVLAGVAMVHLVEVAQRLVGQQIQVGVAVALLVKVVLDMAATVALELLLSVTKYRHRGKNMYTWDEDTLSGIKIMAAHKC